jgi:hypothetical protein
MRNFRYSLDTTARPSAGNDKCVNTLQFRSPHVLASGNLRACGYDAAKEFFSVSLLFNNVYIDKHLFVFSTSLTSLTSAYVDSPFETVIEEKQFNYG